jgi:hypothetical protein
MRSKIVLFVLLWEGAGVTRAFSPLLPAKSTFMINRGSLHALRVLSLLRLCYSL